MTTTSMIPVPGLNVELAEHLGYQRHAVEGHSSGNSRSSYRKALTTEIGKVSIDVPRDRHGTFDRVAVPKGQRRLDGLNANGTHVTPKG